MNKTTVWVALGAAVLGAGIAVLVPSLSGRDSTDTGGPSGDFGGWGGSGPAAPAVVETAVIERGTYDFRAEFVGTLRANARADLYAKTSGQLEAVLVDTGDPVRAGQLLARIENDTQQQQLAQARASLRMAEATLAQRQAAQEIAETTAQRIRNLSRQSLVPQQDLDDAEAQVLGAQAQVEVAEAQVTEASSEVDAAQVQLDRTRIEAPFDGRIGKRYLDVGARAGTNEPVFSVVDLSVIKTTVPLTERDAARVSPGQPATLSTETFPDRRIEGRVARMASVFDPQTHTTEAEIEIDNADGALKPGMFATVTIELQQMEQALLVPAEAVVEEGRETWIFVTEREADESLGPRPASGDGAPEAAGWAATWKVRRIPVETLGGSLGSGQARVAIEPRGALLEPGQQVVTLGQEDLRDGAEVHIAGGPDSRPAHSGAGGAGPGMVTPGDP